MLLQQFVNLTKFIVRKDIAQKMFLPKNRFCSIQNTYNLYNLCQTSRKQKETTVGDIVNLKKDSIFLANANVYPLILPRFRLKVVILRKPIVCRGFEKDSLMLELTLFVSHLYRMESTYECVPGVNQSKCLKSKCTRRGKVKHKLGVTSSNPRDRRLKARVARLRVRVRRLKARAS